MPEPRKGPAHALGRSSSGNTNDERNTTAPGRQDLTPEEILLREAHAIRALGAAVVNATDIGAYAVEYALHGWQIFPLRGKIPAIAGGRGVLDATTDLARIAAWWGGRYRGANIGAKVPQSMIVIDIDPRHGGAETVAALEDRHGPLPTTLTTVSGRGDGGQHLFYRRPPGKLSAARLGPGIDLKTSSGYVVMPPSVHPDSGRPYRRIDAKVVTPPGWLVALLLPEPPRQTEPPKRQGGQRVFTGPSIADAYSSSTTWPEILEPHGWVCLDPDGDSDGARWKHPAATAKWSATVKRGCLFVYSSNTPFTATEAGNPKGYTKFRAYAVLNHHGDLSAAARALKEAA
jgi:hypothetical protein